MTARLDSAEAGVDLAIERVGKRLVVGAPLGLGKPAQLLNAFYRRAVADDSLELLIYTALSLEIPPVGEGVAARLAAPIVERLFGGVVELDYMHDLRAGKIPPNVRLHEFYVKAGSLAKVPAAQQNYISCNYTHVARDLHAAGVNVLLNLVAAEEGDDGQRISLSCNPDVSLELVRRLREGDGRPWLALAQVNSELPFMPLDAEVGPGFFDAILDSPETDTPLFAVPNSPVPLQDYAAALHASALVPDGGTLQIGIGALGDALAHSLVLRQQSNDVYGDLLSRLARTQGEGEFHWGCFDKGLYGCTEMFVSGMLALIDAGVLKRPVFDHTALQCALNDGQLSQGPVDPDFIRKAIELGIIPPVLTPDDLTRLQTVGVLPESLSLVAGQLCIGGQSYLNFTADPDTAQALQRSATGAMLRGGHILHGGFFLGPRDFYRQLREMDHAQRSTLCMTGVERTNQLLLDVPLYCAQRQQARFINTAMMVTLSGAVVSDGLEDGTVVSGVGGQYNFVAMAHDLPGARSVICVRSTRGQGDKLRSNIVSSYGHTTIPRHLRDLVVTEYGVADLRGQGDAEVAKRLLCITDSRFQRELLEAMQQTGKIEAGWEIPLEHRHNTPERIQSALGSARENGLLPAFPFGTDLTGEEVALGEALRSVQAESEDLALLLPELLRALLHRPDSEAAKPYLERLGLEHPDSGREFLIQQLLLLELEQRGYLRGL